MLIYMGLAFAFLAIIWTFIKIIFFKGHSKTMKVVYGFMFFVCTISAYFSTYKYTYYLNENTRVCGWPIPIVIFQRHDAASQWLDFVGFTMVLGFPLNLFIFMFLPSLLMLILAMRKGQNPS